MPVHLSVQANAVNFATVKFWARQGVERIILPRELLKMSMALIS
ncbi:U32 family peptidase [Endozoicomonas sp. YOMI1]